MQRSTRSISVNVTALVAIMLIFAACGAPAPAAVESSAAAPADVPAAEPATTSGEEVTAGPPRRHHR